MNDVSFLSLTRVVVLGLFGPLHDRLNNDTIRASSPILPSGVIDPISVDSIPDIGAARTCVKSLRFRTSARPTLEIWTACRSPVRPRPELTTRTFGTILREGSPSFPSLGPILSCLSQGLTTTRSELPLSRYLHAR